MSHDRSREESAVDGLRDTARALAERELAGGSARPQFAEIVARAHRIDPRAVPHGWIDAARRGVSGQVAAPRRAWGTSVVIGVAAALVLALCLRQGLRAREFEVGQGSLAGLLGAAAERRAAAEGARTRRAVLTPSQACPEGQAGCATCPEGQVQCVPAPSCVPGQAGCAAEANCPPGQVGCVPAPSCVPGQVGCAAEANCPAGCAPRPGCLPGQDGCVAAGDCPAGQAGCASVGCPPGQRCDGAEPRRSKPGKEDLGARLRRLDDEAEASLRAGDLAGADERYVEIAAIGGSRPEVEHAFVDRFGVARTRRDTAAQRRLWQAYLERFPGGSFADDAQAGLCRTAEGGEQENCWTRYLEKFPAGAHRREAGHTENTP